MANPCTFLECKMLFVYIKILLIFATTAQSNGEGCVTAGMTSCCLSDSCQVSSQVGSCFCDATCYSTRDCCNDIEFICPPPTSDGLGDGDVGSGSGAPPTTGTTPTSFPPALTIFESSSVILVDTTITTRLFINVTYDPGNPQGMLEWRHNGAIISSRTDPRVTILSQGGLSIRNIKPSDRGVYTVTAFNSLGSASENFSVLVKFIMISRTQVDTAGDEASFGCLAIGYPNVSFVTWQTATGINVSGSVEIVIHKNFYETISISTLRGIDPLTCDQAGGYVCIYDDGRNSSTAIRSEVLECPISLVEVSFEQPSYNFTEKSGFVEVCVVASFNTSTSPISVSISEASGNAEAGVDFVLTSRDVTLRPDMPQSCVTVLLIDDINTENTEDFELIITSNSSLVLVTGSNATVSIQDDDLIRLMFEETLYEISESVADASSHLALQVCVVQNRRPGQLIEDPQTVDIIISTVDWTAKGGLDFVPVSVTRSFSLASADTRVCECVVLLPDRVAEGLEYFAVTVKSPSPQVIGSKSGIKIIDDDEVMINFERTQYFVKEDVNTLEVCVVATGGAGTGSLAVYICTNEDTATDGEDYKGLTAHRVMFPRATSSTTKRVCVTIPIFDDTQLESAEQFSLNLQRDPRMPRNVQIVPNSTAYVTILDNDAPTAMFVNNTPYVQGNSIQINFIVQSHGFTFSHILCTLTGPGKTPSITRICSHGVVLFSHLPYRYQEFLVTIEGVVNGSRTVLNRRAVRLDTDVCSLHFVNEGISGSGANQTIQWQGTGPSSYNRVSQFTCWKDRVRTRFPCVSPFTWTELSPGAHSFTVEPVPTIGCRRHVSRVLHFTV